MLSGKDQRGPSIRIRPVVRGLRADYRSAAKSGYACHTVARGGERLAAGLPRRYAGGADIMSTRILVVEDHELMRDLIAKALRRAGYLVMTANNGEEGLTRFR